MEKPQEYSIAELNPQGKSTVGLEKDQEKILGLYENWESNLQFLKQSNKNWRQDSITKETLFTLAKIDELWYKSRKRLFSITNQSNEPVSIIQYRMMRFIQKRKEYRVYIYGNEFFPMGKEKFEKKITSNILVIILT